MIVISYEDSFYVDYENGKYLVRDYYGSEVYRADNRLEAEYVVLWAQEQAKG